MRRRSLRPLRWLRDDVVAEDRQLDDTGRCRRSLAAGAGVRGCDRRDRELLLRTRAGCRVPPRRLAVDGHHRSTTRSVGHSRQPLRGPIARHLPPTRSARSRSPLGVAAAPRWGDRAIERHSSAGRTRESHAPLRARTRSAGLRAIQGHTCRPRHHSDASHRTGDDPSPQRRDRDQRLGGRPAATPKQALRDI